MKGSKTGKRVGRPLSFDKGEALDAAMQVFWREGYEGASLTELTEAMGINRPSLYAAFGSKETLFRQVLDRYEKGPAGYVRRALEEPVARDVVTKLMTGAADLTAAGGGPRGCLMVQGALACSDAVEPVREELTARRDAGEAALRQRLERAQEEGDLPANSNPEEMARYVVTVIQGMGVQAAGGASREELQKVIDVAMRVWPEPKE